MLQGIVDLKILAIDPWDPGMMLRIPSFTKS